MKQKNLNFLMIIFLPLIFSFTLPLLFYRIPIKAVSFNQKIEFSSSDILYATMVWLVWIGIAIITPLLLSRIKNSNGSQRHWSLVTIWRGFIVLSVLGVLISPLQYFFIFNIGIEQLLQQLSIAPVVAVVVGIRAVRDIHLSDERRRRLRLLVGALLLSLNSAAALILPILMGRAAPAVYAGIAILYGLNALKIDRKQRIALWLVFFMLAGFAIAFKNSFRMSSFGTGFSGHFTRIPIEDVFTLKIQELPEKALSKQVDHTRQQDVILVDDRKSFSWLDNPLTIVQYGYYDPNYNDITYFFLDDYITEHVKYLIAKTINRVNHLGDLANVIRLTPDSIPYMKGSTYYPLLFKPIPRLFWKDKPEDNSGQIYGHRYGVLDVNDMTTSANMGVIIEAWINGGWMVIVLSGFTFGAMIYLVWRNLVGESGEIGNIVLGTVFVASGVATESSMNLVMGGMIYVVLVWWVIEYNIRTKL